MAKKIYVADDEQSIRDIIFRFLSKEGFEVSTFSTGDELLDAFKKEKPDLVILDIIMPGTDGFVISSRLRKLSSVPIIIVSARDSEIDRVTGFSLGSDDYLTKPFSPSELVVRVKSCLRRIEMDTGNYGQQNVYEYSNIKIDTSTRDAYIDDTRIDLTPTEYSLMIYFIKNHSIPISREELLENVWKYDFGIDTRATDDVIKRLRKKLIGANSKAKIESVWGFGFKFIEQEPQESK